MPLVYQQNINGGTKVGVWHIAEPERFFISSVGLQRVISHPHKRLQHLAGRFLLTHLFDDFPLHLINIADTRKPFLKDEEFHFSISHCGDYAAVIASRENRVGVDIEIPQQKILYLKDRFLRKEEANLLMSTKLGEREQYTLGWSIKEALYKWYGSGQVDFLQHLKIEDIKNVKNQFISECVVSKETISRLTSTSLQIENNLLSWVIS